MSDSAGVPRLFLALDYDRAWATVGQALESAGMPVESSRKDDRVVEIVYDPSLLGDGGAGFLQRANPFSSAGRKRPVELHFLPSERGFYLQVFDDADEPSGEAVSQAVLEMISDNAS